MFIFLKKFKKKINRFNLKIGNKYYFKTIKKPKFKLIINMKFKNLKVLKLIYIFSLSFFIFLNHVYKKPISKKIKEKSLFKI